MSIYELFSKRQKRLRGEVPDVFTYDTLPSPLRVQIVHIIRDAIGKDYYGNKNSEDAYKYIHDTLCREYGLFSLSQNQNSFENAVFNFFLQQKDLECALDVVEFCFFFIDNFVRNSPEHHAATVRSLMPDLAILELNYRFREHGIGYQYESGKMIRIDSEYLHSEAIKPALYILSEKIYQGANEEFLKAHEHYRHGRYKETLGEALKAFESVMKVICDKHRWPFGEGDTAKRLIDICLENELIPGYLQSQFSSLRSILESGVPTIRNKLGGHGQGSQTTTVSAKMARYALNLTAANIVFLAEHEKLLSKK
jgi:hypothetical protein